MPQRDTMDFATAFGLGVIAGVAAALLLRPEPPGPVDRIVKDLKPYRALMRGGARRARKGLGEGAAAATEIGGALRDASRVLLEDFRTEMADIADAVRDDIAHAVDEKVRHAQALLSKGARRLKVT